MLLFWGVVIWLIVLGIKKVTKGGKSSRGKSALDIGEDRYQRIIDTGNSLHNR